MLIDGKDVNVGDVVKFNTVNNYDPNLWQGTVVATGSYEIAKAYTDVDAYHQNVLRNEAVRDQFLVGGSGGYIEASQLTYFIVKCLDGVIRAFAPEWVEPTTLVIIDVNSNAVIKVYNIAENQIATLLNLLKDNGYVVRHIS